LTAEEVDRAIGRLYREHQELKRTLTAIKTTIEEKGRALRTLADAFAHEITYKMMDQLIESLPTQEELSSLLQEYRSALARKGEIERALKDAGMDVT
jgi:hypothetical protein